MDITDQVQDSVAKAKEKVLEDLDFMNLGKTRAVFFIHKYVKFRHSITKAYISI